MSGAKKGRSHERATYKQPTPERSRLLAAVRSKGNRSTELAFATLCRRNKLSGWRRHVDMLGRPDFVFRSKRVVVFVDGCFWHGCPTCYRSPTRNFLFWAEKVERNRKRDRSISNRLRKDGWFVLRVWEHSLIKPNQVLARVVRACARLSSSQQRN